MNVASCGQKGGLSGHGIMSQAIRAVGASPRPWRWMNQAMKKAGCGALESRNRFGKERRWRQWRRPRGGGGKGRETKR